MTISILGCGWLGLPLGKALLKAGHNVKGSTTSPEKLATIHQAGIEPFLIKITEDIVGERLNDFFNTDLVILNIPPGRRKPNVEEQHPRQIRAVAQYLTEAEVGKLLFVSSTGVYPNLNKVVTEADETKAERPSTRALIIAENLLQLQNGFQTTILRMAGLVGGNRKAGRFLAGKKNVPNGDAPINLVHRDDCIAIIKEIIRLEKWDGTYNICADEHPTRRAFYIAQAYKEDLEPPTFTDDQTKVEYKIVSNQKIKTELNYIFQHPDPMQF
ncbi:MAG: SDR family oxidoreductase [Saprospiraceae bacterium]